MKVTCSGEYGINGLLYVAKRGQGKLAYVREVSEALHISQSFLSKIFQSFVRKGILHSHRGAKGGYSLARPAREITLKEALEAAQGPIALNRCLLGRRRPCGRHRRCGLHWVLSAAQRSIEERFNKTTVAHLAQTTQFLRSS